MPKIVGIDHLVLSVGDFARSKEFYGKLLKFLGFKLKHEYEDMAGWSNGKTLFWIAAADAEGKKRKYRKGDIGFHHYAFELASRKDVDALGAFLDANGMNVVDPPGEYYGRNYYAVYFTDPDGMKLEGMIWAPPETKRKAGAAAKRRRTKRRRKSRKPANPDGSPQPAAALTVPEKLFSSSVRRWRGEAGPGQIKANHEGGREIEIVMGAILHVVKELLQRVGRYKQKH